MRHARTLAVAVAGLVLSSAAGCGEKSKYVPVSGVVKLNNRPYANAVVTFQPVGSKDDPNPGRGSYGVTDENGRFTLKSDGGVTGAVIGLHQVKIRTQGETVGYDPNVGSADNAPVPKSDKFDPIPIEWRSLSEKNTFEVPDGGTDQANFEIVNPRVK